MQDRGNGRQRHTGNGRFPLPRTSLAPAHIQVDISDILTRTRLLHRDVFFTIFFFFKTATFWACGERLIVGAKTPPFRDKLEVNYWRRRRSLSRCTIIIDVKKIKKYRRIPPAITDAKETDKRLANGFGSSLFTRNLKIKKNKKL